MSNELVSYRHTVGESGLHLQFTPAYRKPIFAIPKVKQLTKLYIQSKANQMNIIISAMDFGPDHIHMFINSWKNYSIEHLAKSLKGFSSRMMKKNHRKLFKHLLWGKKFWSSGYFHRTVGAITAESTQYYISHTQKKHWKVLDYEVYKQKQLNQFIN